MLSSVEPYANAGVAFPPDGQAGMAHRPHISRFWINAVYNLIQLSDFRTSALQTTDHRSARSLVHDGGGARAPWNGRSRSQTPGTEPRSVRFNNRSKFFGSRSSLPCLTPSLCCIDIGLKINGSLIADQPAISHFVVPSHSTNQFLNPLQRSADLWTDLWASETGVGGGHESIRDTYTPTTNKPSNPQVSDVAPQGAGRSHLDTMTRARRWSRHPNRNCALFKQPRNDVPPDRACD